VIDGAGHYDMYYKEEYVNPASIVWCCFIRSILPPEQHSFALRIQRSAVVARQFMPDKDVSEASSHGRFALSCDTYFRRLNGNDRSRLT
jgi:hypothetical protein